MPDTPTEAPRPARPTREVFAVRIGATERRVIAQAAKRRGIAPSAYVRQIAVEQARRENAAFRAANAIRNNGVEAA